MALDRAREAGNCPSWDGTKKPNKTSHSNRH